MSLCAEASHALRELGESADKALKLIGEIAASSQEQVKGIEQVNNAIAGMDKVTQNTAARAEESAAASGELAGEAKRLQHAVDELVQLISGVRGEAEQAAIPDRPVAVG